MSRRKKVVVAVIAATVLGIAAVGCAEAPAAQSAEAAEATQPQPQPKEQPAPESVKKQLREEQLENPEEDIEITAEMVVDLMFAEPGQMRPVLLGVPHDRRGGLQAVREVVRQAGRRPPVGPRGL